MTNWTTIASLATAGGTLVLAVATFVSVRQGNRATRISERAARVAEQSLLAQLNLVHQDDTWIASTVRHVNLDRPDPR